MTTFKKFLLIVGVVGLPAALAYAVNVVPLKPDSANSAPATVFGSPTPGMSIGKTTAPSGALDVVGNVNVTGTITGSLAAGSVDSTKIATGAIDSTKLATNAVTLSKIASGAVDTSKLLIDGVVDTAKIVCGKGSKSFGFCTDSPTGTPPTCNCQ